jgi:hypothetical protein
MVSLRNRPEYSDKAISDGAIQRKSTCWVRGRQLVAVTGKLRDAPSKPATAVVAWFDHFASHASFFRESSFCLVVKRSY